MFEIETCRNEEEYSFHKKMEIVLAEKYFNKLRASGKKRDIWAIIVDYENSIQESKIDYLNNTLCIGKKMKEHIQKVINSQGFSGKIWMYGNYKFLVCISEVSESELENIVFDIVKNTNNNPTNSGIYIGFNKIDKEGIIQDLLYKSYLASQIGKQHNVSVKKWDNDNISYKDMAISTSFAQDFLLGVVSKDRIQPKETLIREAITCLLIEHNMI